MANQLLSTEVQRAINDAVEHTRGAMYHADRLITSAYGRGRSLEPKVIEEVRQQFYREGGQCGRYIQELHELVCDGNPENYVDETAARRKAIRVIRARAACSYHRARETYDALSAAGLL